MRARWMVAAVVVGGLALTGCGSDDDGDGGATATTADGGGSDTTAGGFSGDGSGEFCDKAREIEDNPAFGEDLMSGSGDELKESVEDVQGALSDMRDTAPGEIKEDVEALAAAWGTFRDLLEEYDFDFVKLAEAAAKDPSVQQELTDQGDAVTAAEGRLTTYLRDVCGIEDAG